MSHIDPTQEQIARFSDAQGEGPIVMLNLLRFRDSVGEGGGGRSGEEAYRRYGEAIAPNLAPGGRRRASPGQMHRHRHRA